MKEAFLHFIWRTGRFDHHELRTTTGESISLFRRGQYNRHGGPDFTTGHLRIGNTVWHGHIEMHLFSSDWLRHNHQSDPAYENTILHVVWEEDKPIFRRDGTRLPCLELRQRVAPRMLYCYHRLLEENREIACQGQLPRVPELIKRSMLDRTLIERLDMKSQQISQKLDQLGGDWEETVYQTLARGLGLPVNGDPFEQLTRQLPLRLLQRYRSAPYQVAALLFGQAGLLPALPEQSYPQQLVREYQFLQAKHNLQPMGGEQWKFLRMRPVNFPTLRVARLASLVVHHENWLQNILYAGSAQEWLNSMEVLLHPYWSTRYRFGPAGKRKRKGLGSQFGQTLVINVMVPILFTYGKARGENQWQERALDILENHAPERHHISRKWQGLGLPQENAGHSQGLLHLQRSYCERKRCLECAIGCHLMARLRTSKPTVAEEHPPRPYPERLHLVAPRKNQLLHPPYMQGEPVI